MPMRDEKMVERGKQFASIAKGGRVRNLDLRGAELAGADLSRLSADELDLGAADLSLAKVRESRFGNCRFERVNIERADWSGATLRMCVLDGAQGSGSRFDGARIEDSSAKAADLTGASLRAAKLTETSFERAVLREAVFDDAEGEAVQFRGADLAGASLIGARLDEADFRGADLQGADLSRGRFRGADFRGTILEGTRFDGADCAGARFDEGAGPRPGAASDAGAKSSVSFGAFESTALRQGLAALPEELKAWREPLQKMLSGEGTLDPKAVRVALGEAPAALQNVLAAGGAPVVELLERLRHMVAALDANPDQPPEEWKPWLEPLLKMAEKGQPLDLRAVLDALSSLAHGRPSAAEQTITPPAKEPDERGR